MNKYLGLPLLACALLLPAARASAPPASLQEGALSVIVDKRLVGGAFVRNGVAYLPLRTVAKYLQLNVRYDPDSQIIFINTPHGKKEDTHPSVQ